MEQFEVDIVIPVYNEGVNIVPVLRSLAAHVKAKFRILICYDSDEDSTLDAIRNLGDDKPPVLMVKNEGVGVLGAIVTGFTQSSAPVVLMMPADDNYNAPRLDAMLERFPHGVDMVCPSRFMSGGCMVGCPWLKATIVRMTAWFMYFVVGVPTRDPTNGFRFFSRRVLDQTPIETVAGFAYSIELLVKCHRLGWVIEESPVRWYERKAGTSRFRVFKWAPVYLQWVRYALATRFLGRGPASVVLKSGAAAS
jgi:dolichol-phosphate mannosyltransferase